MIITQTPRDYVSKSFGTIEKIKIGQARAAKQKMLKSKTQWIMNAIIQAVSVMTQMGCYLPPQHYPDINQSLSFSIIKSKLKTEQIYIFSSKN